MSAHPSAEQLSAFLDQELSDAVRVSVEEHLRTCDACAAHLAELASVDEAARALPLEAPAGYFDDFAARVRGRVVARPARRAPPVWTWAAAAAVLLAVVTPLALRERASQSTVPIAMRAEAGPPAAPAPAAAPAASAPKPQAAPTAADGGAMTEAERGPAEAADKRAHRLEQPDRLVRRDQAAESAPLSELQASDDKREAPAPEPSPAALPPARLEEKAVDGVRTFGYASPPSARSQRPHGPHLQQQVAPPPAAAPAPADGEVASNAEAGAPGAAGGLRDADLAKEKDDRSQRQKLASSSEGAGRAASAGGAAEAVQLRATGPLLKAAPRPAETGDEARRRREAFRQMVLQDPEGPAADEARVGTIEQGVRAYRLERRAEDRATAERDGRAYLARPDALQAAKVRALLKELKGVR
jgi:anti-sigma factor RsiW